MIDIVHECLRMVRIERAMRVEDRPSRASDQDLDTVAAMLVQVLRASPDDRLVASGIPPGMSRIALETWDLTSDLAEMIARVQDGASRLVVRWGTNELS
jgi:hypothetical protein